MGILMRKISSSIIFYGFLRNEEIICSVLKVKQLKKESLERGNVLNIFKYKCNPNTEKSLQL